nr:MAG TPA: hypothetical protein [Caudoviricetes sp.]
MNCNLSYIGVYGNIGSYIFSRRKYKAYNRQISLYLKGEMIYDH